MTAKQHKAIQAVRNTLHENCKDMDLRQYREVMQELQSDLEDNLGALTEEEGDAWLGCVVHPV